MAPRNLINQRTLGPNLGNTSVFEFRSAIELFLFTVSDLCRLRIVSGCRKADALTAYRMPAPVK